MKALERIKEVMREVADSASRRFDDARDAPRRSKLLLELGRLVHRQHRGEEVAAHEMDDILSEIDAFDADTALDQGSQRETSTKPPEESEARP